MNAAQIAGTDAFEPKATVLDAYYRLLGFAVLYVFRLDAQSIQPFPDSRMFEHPFLIISLDGASAFPGTAMQLASFFSPPIAFIAWSMTAPADGVWSFIVADHASIAVFRQDSTHSLKSGRKQLQLMTLRIESNAAETKSLRC